MQGNKKQNQKNWGKGFWAESCVRMNKPACA